MAKKAFVYGLFDPESHELCYVGVTVDCAARFKQHIAEARSRSGDSVPKEVWIRSVLERGFVPAMFVLEVTEETKMRRCERKWISRMQSRGMRIRNSRVMRTLTKAEVQEATPINFALLQLVETAAEIFDRADADPVIRQLGQSFWRQAKKARLVCEEALVNP